MKKVYLFLCGMLSLLTFSTVSANCDFANSNYEQERKEAYFWACNEGIISEGNINSANLNKELSRLEMAKMLNTFAMKLMGKEENPSNNCKGYSDLNYSEHLIANKSCYLGIMGVGIDKFRPKDSVSRAEFGTVLSRILYGDKYNVTNGKYYEKHLKALKDNGVITNTNPSLKEKKGYVLLMLKRYVDNKDRENTKMEILYKSDDGYIIKNGTDITFSDNKNSITISNITTNIKNEDLSRGNLPRTDSLQGPCAPGYHIPSKDEAEKLINIWFDIRKQNLDNVDNKNGVISQNGGYENNIVYILSSDIYGRKNGISSQGCFSYLTRSHNYETNGIYFLTMCGGKNNYLIYVDAYNLNNHYIPIICFKTS